MNIISLSTMLFLLCGALSLTGCAGYTRGSNLPAELRTVNVAAFENETLYPMAGAMVTQHLMRAMSEDGTFTFTDLESAPLRIHGKVSGLNTRPVRYDRNNLILPNEYKATLVATIYVYNMQTGEMLLNGQNVSAEEYFFSRNDYSSGIQDALPALSAKLAQNILEHLHTLGERPTLPSTDPAAPATEEDPALDPLATAPALTSPEAPVAETPDAPVTPVVETPDVETPEAPETPVVEAQE